MSILSYYLHRCYIHDSVLHDCTMLRGARSNECLGTRLGPSRIVAMFLMLCCIFLDIPSRAVCCSLLGWRISFRQMETALLICFEGWTTTALLFENVYNSLQWTTIEEFFFSCCQIYNSVLFHILSDGKKLTYSLLVISHPISIIGT